MNSSTPASQHQKIKAASSRARRLTEQESDHLALLQHLQRLIQADPQGAREALEMSQEHLPEIFQIAQNQFPKEWATALMNSDSMHSLLSRNLSQAKELLQEQDLQSLLEKMS